MGTGATNMSTTQHPEALRAAAQAVIDRWETPLWKDVPATAEYIAALRDALEADHFEGKLDMVARWYMVTKDGAATLCVDREDAEHEAKINDAAWPNNGPHRAVQLVEAADVEALRTGYAAARLEIESLQARIRTMAEEHAQAAPESFLEIPDVQDESGINSHYSRELVLECINAALGSHGQAPAQAAPAAVAEPVEWRELAARVMDALADAQEQTNSAYPAHASRYPAWEAHLRWLRWHADMFRTGKPVGSGAGQPAVLAALAAAPASVLEDAERLDWLESNSQINIERVRYLGATKSIYEVTPYDSISYDGETLRAAIDAARGIGIKNGDSNGLKT